MRRERRADLAVLDSYASAVRNYQSQYQDLRSKLEDFLAEIDGRGVTFEEAYNGLGDALSGRAQLKQGMSALDAPSALSHAHNSVVSALGRATDALNAAYSGTIDYEYDTESYDSYRDTPGWKDFTSASNALAGEYAAAVAAWEEQLKTARARIARKKLPPKPEL